MNTKESKKSGWIVYPIGSKPKWPLAVLLGIQQYLTMFGATVLIPFIIGGAMKLPQEQLALMISTIFFTSGICTLIQQSALGNRLPIIQGGTFSFLGPTFAILGMVAAKQLSGPEPLWQIQIQEVAGAIMIASVFEIVLGYTGIIGQVQKYIGPITIGPTIALIGLSLFGIGAGLGMASNWIIRPDHPRPDRLLPGFQRQITDVHALPGAAVHHHRLAAGVDRNRDRHDLPGQSGLCGPN